MVRWKKFFLIFMTLFVLGFLCLHMFVNIRGRDLLSKKLEETFNRKVEIGSLYTTFPANIFIKNIEVKGLFKVDEISAGRGLIDIFEKDFNLSYLKVSKPVVTLEKLPEKPPEESKPAIAPTIPQGVDMQPKEPAKTIKPPSSALEVFKKSFSAPRFSIGRLIVSDGAVNFTDKSMLGKDLTIKVEHINLRIDNLSLGRRGIQITSFDLKGDIPWREVVEKGKISADGWIDFKKRDMQATFKIQDIDGVYLYPYYSNWVDLEKLRIEKANLNFNSNIHGLNNNVTAECHLELTDIIRKPRPPEEAPEKAEKVAAAVLDIFKSLDEGKIVLDFTVRTKMDKPEFGFGNIKMALQDKIAQVRSSLSPGPQDIFMLPAHLVEGMFKGAADLSRAMVDGTFAVGNELKKSVEQSFRKQPK